MAEIPRRPFLFWQTLLVVAAALLPYLGALDGSFVYDDHILAESDPQREAGLWTTHLGTGLWGELPAMGYYRPLVTLSFEMDRRLGGGAPFSFHLTNLLLHVALVLAAWRVAGWLCRSPPVALAAAVLFAVHPVHVEAVAWISGRGDLLAPLLGMLAWLALLSGGWLPACGWRRNTPSWPHLVGSALLLLGALLAKESALAFPLMAAVGAGFGWLTLASGEGPADGTRRLLLAAGAGLLSIVTWMLLRWNALSSLFGRFGVDPFENPAAGLSAADRIPTAAAALLNGLGVLFWPHPLRLDYSVPVLGPVSLASPFGILAAGSLALLLLMPLLWLTLRRSSTSALEPAALGLGLILAGWLPVSSLGPPPGDLLAERFLVIPSFGWALLAGSLLCAVGRLWRPQSRGGRLPALAVIVALVVVPLAVRSAYRVEAWQDDDTLLASEIRAGTYSFRVSFMLGLRAYADGDFKGAGERFATATRAAPGFSRGWEGLARSHLSAGETTDALQAAQTAIVNEPPLAATRARYRVLLAETEWAAGNPREALPPLQEAMHLDTESAAAPRRLGDLLFEMERYEPAIGAYREAVAREPLDAVAWFNLGIALAFSDRTTEARDVLERVIGFPEGPPEARFHLGVLAEQRGDDAAARRHYGELLRTGRGRIEAGMIAEAERRMERLSPGEPGP